MVDEKEMEAYEGTYSTLIHGWIMTYSRTDDEPSSSREGSHDRQDIEKGVPAVC